MGLTAKENRPGSRPEADRHSQCPQAWLGWHRVREEDLPWHRWCPWNRNGWVRAVIRILCWGAGERGKCVHWWPASDAPLCPFTSRVGPFVSCMLPLRRHFLPSGRVEAWPRPTLPSDLGPSVPFLGLSCLSPQVVLDLSPDSASDNTPASALCPALH